MIPITSLSYSRLRLYLTNKMAFWRHYVTQDYNPPRTATMVEGSILHRMAEHMILDSIDHKKGRKIRPVEQSGALAALDEFIAEEFPTIDIQGVSKLTEAHIQKHGAFVAQNLITHFNKHLEHTEGMFIGAECSMESFISDQNGYSLPLPFVGKVDAVTIENDPITGEPWHVIHDYKMVRSTSEETLQKNHFIYQFQAHPYYLLAQKHFQTQRVKVVYHFFKVTESQPRKGKDPMPAIVSYTVPTPSEEDLRAFVFLNTLLLNDLQGLPSPAGGPVMFPNIFDQAGNGQHQWELFREHYRPYI